MEFPPRPTLFDFHGVSMTRYFTDNWENVQKLEARSDDIVLASYPKAGNTWVSYILDLLYCTQSSPEQQDTVPLYEKVPFLELYCPGFLNGVDGVNQMTSFPRIIKTHLPVPLLPQSIWEQSSKIIYVARNAKDSVVSYFHFDRMNKAQPEPGDWSSFLHRFMEGKMVFGSWYEHVTCWWEKKQTRSNILYLFYEDLIEDFDRELNRLCSFLELSPSAEKKKHITEKVLFKNTKHNKMVNMSTNEAFDFNISQFIREGNVGDWKNHFTVQQDEE
ncbi:cytosolic sulfotransferase 1, partial [Austrofundulus limnaeus]|uniref:Sulfotransferase n=1 Tax=Austrofundulus limnaeus TaxID=52670 RepID=A0A2I4AM75_AUSLI